MRVEGILFLKEFSLHMSKDWEALFRVTDALCMLCCLYYPFSFYAGSIILQNLCNRLLIVLMNIWFY